MEETLGLSEGERKRSDEWRLGDANSLSTASDTSLHFQKTFHLHLIPKNEILSERKVIPSTKMERLSYFRTYVSSMTKTQIICMQHERFNIFLWYYVFTTIFKSLPHTFTCIFLASYSCEEHIFLTKMVPICAGYKIGSIIAAILELLTYTDTLMFILDYFCYGLIYKNPWNRCYALPSSIYEYHSLSNVSWECYDILEFTNKIDEITKRNGTISFIEYYYKSLNETFQLSQLEYYRGRNLYFGKFQIETFIYFCIIWITAALFHEKVYTRKFWKVLNKVQWIVNSIDLISFVYLIASYFDTESNIEYKKIHDHAYADILWKADVDMLAESTTAPPVVHVLTARGLGEIEPSRDSAIMITSNALLYIFRGILHFRVKDYCENMIKVPIYVTVFNQHTWFYVWPMFFSKFNLGNIYTLIFLLTNFAMEFLTIIVTYHCVVEVIVCEFKWLNKCVTFALTVVGIGMFTVTSNNDRVLLYIYSAGIITLIETVVLYYMYPIGRLVDDITFHCGIPPTRLRIISLHLVPVYYSIKIYIMMQSFIQFMVKSGMVKSVPHYTWSWSLTVIPVVLGAFYNSYVYVVKNKLEWKYLFCPSPTWGPRDYTSRHLRKQYDSRTYIGSQAPKNLSRDLLSKIESKSYRLDVRYDIAYRRSTIPTFEVHRVNTRKFK